MAQAALPSPTVRLRAGWLRLVGDNALPIVALAATAAFLASALPFLLVPDSWLAFVDGRHVAAHGLPHTDTLTAWTLGRPWIDQQWGAQLVLYALAQHGGLRVATAVGAACVVAALAVAAVAARRLGAT